MSAIIARWIIQVRDRMPATIRDSAAWRELLLLSAGTGQNYEAERQALILDWMWDALALLQLEADARGYGVEWATMLRDRTVASAKTAAASAATAAYAYEDAVAFAAYAYHAAAASYAYADASASADPAKVAVAVASEAAAEIAYADAVGVAAAAEGAYADAYADAYAVAVAAAWTTIDPVGLLRRLVAVTDARALAVQPVATT